MPVDPHAARKEADCLERIAALKGVAGHDFHALAKALVAADAAGDGAGAEEVRWKLRAAVWELDRREWPALGVEPAQ